MDGSVLKRIVRSDGASACTHYRVLYQEEGRCLLSLLLDTGRTHQIRVHLSHIGCPLLGDFLYGTELPSRPNSFALHAAMLRLQHPMTRESLDVFSPLPPELLALLPHIPTNILNKGDLF